MVLAQLFARKLQLFINFQTWLWGQELRKKGGYEWKMWIQCSKKYIKISEIQIPGKNVLTFCCQFSLIIVIQSLFWPTLPRFLFKNLIGQYTILRNVSNLLDLCLSVKSRFTCKVKFLSYDMIIAWRRGY